MSSTIWIDEKTGWKVSNSCFGDVLESTLEEVPPHAPEEMKQALRDPVGLQFLEWDCLGSEAMRLVFDSLLKMYEKKLQNRHQAREAYESRLAAIRTLIALMGQDSRVACPLFPEELRRDNPLILKLKSSDEL